LTGPISFVTDEPIRTEDELLDYLRSGARPRDQWGVGLEYERLGLDLSAGRGIPYGGERGVERVLLDLADRFGWEADLESGRPVGLVRGGTRIALEPGGQVELSGDVHREFGTMRTELAAHLQETAAVGRPLGIAWAALGVHPWSRVEEIDWIPKARYGLMGPFLGSRGALAHHMMKGTAGIQVNLDYAGEEDAAEKIRVAMGITSIVSAICANSPVYAGRLTGFLSRRMHIWSDTDPARCGLLAFALREDFRFRDYLEYALDVPVMSVQRSGRLIPTDGIPFRTFLREGRGAIRATHADWALHLTTIFTEVRLKTYIEVRGADSVMPSMAIGVAALWKGILYDAQARRLAWSLVARPSFAERAAFHGEVAVLGPEARLGPARAVDLALDLVRIAREGLRRIGDEADLLDPIEASLVEEGGCPAARLARAWREGEIRSPADLLETGARDEARFLEEFSRPRR